MKQNNIDMDLKDTINRIRMINEEKRNTELNQGIELVYDDTLETRLGQEGINKLKELLNGFIENANSSMRDFYVSHDGSILTIRTRLMMGGNEVEVVIDGYSDSPTLVMSDTTLELSNDVIQSFNSISRFYNAVGDEIKMLSR